MSPPPSKFRFSIDRGGTFTDVFAQCPGGGVRVCKLLSKNEACYRDAPTEGIRRIIAEETGRSLKPGEAIPSELIETIRMGTTVATNALLERKGERTGLLITKGFRDLLHIGNQARPNIFDLEVKCPENLYEEVVEVDERVILARGDCQLGTEGLRKVQVGSGQEVMVQKGLDRGEVEEKLRGMLGRGIRSLAVVFIHAWVWDEHEREVKEVAEKVGFKHVSVSSEVMKMVRAVPRGFTTVVDSYTTPLIKDYLESFKKGFTDLKPNQVLFMQSDGGLTPMNRFCGSRAVLSGPAGGVVGYARTVYDRGDAKAPVIGFDMGGTSTDVSRYDGEFLHSFENCTAGVLLQTAQLDIQTVAAGGGSILSFRSGIYNVGPESAGANPGPVAYDQGGTELTITDANLVLNRLLPARFPKIFGERHDSELNSKKTLAAFEKLTGEINQFNEEHGMAKLSLQEVALGFVRVANETMARPIRNITQGKGFDPANHNLACFGGAGGQHACAIAESLGIKRVVVPRYAGILSAVGIFLADVVVEGNEPVGRAADGPELDDYVRGRFQSLCGDLGAKLREEGDDFSEVHFEKYLNIRYTGTDCSIMVKGEGDVGNFCRSFVDEYSRQFGFNLERGMIVDDLRVRAVGVCGDISGAQGGDNQAGGKGEPIGKVPGYFKGVGQIECPVFDAGNEGVYDGPCLILDELSTIVVEPGCQGRFQGGSVKLDWIGEGYGLDKAKGLDKGPPKLDSIVLSVFSHRFMSIAEQMGRILQRTSVSTNIKERLDFSCAIFGPDGGLVSNAPHIPCHLGAMQEAVQFQLKVGEGCKCGGCGGGNGDCLRLYPGDVLLSNHPSAGGSHLPDLTVITPVFDPSSDSPKPIFFVANRGHHADIGGITPGSMPPHSKSIHEEGAVFTSFKLVKSGQWMEEELIRELNRPGDYPGSSGTRNLSDNLSDLRAQVAANQKGIGLIQSLVKEYSLPYVQAYMRYIQENAEVAVREMLRSVGRSFGDKLRASDWMDDGSEIRLKVDIDKETGSGIFDFRGSGWEVLGNCNAPRAITLSAVIYCLRCLVGRDIPLNQGCLRPIQIIIPEGSILCPGPEAAVVGGNVLTSQRVVDVILKAFGACAASQGCMNNTTFGDEGWGYYETIAGGAGAGPGWEGRSGVHSHMTNTRITDVEILEVRYPVLVNHFSLEKGSGCKGKNRGGDGCRREMLFRKALKLSVLSERRVFSPYGMEGGGNGGKGQNLLIRGYYAKMRKEGTGEGKNPRYISLGGKTSVDVAGGDLLVVITPGGGGWGKP